MRIVPAAVAAPVLAAAVLALAGCSDDPVGLLGPARMTGPAADSPVAAVEAVRWAHEHRDTTFYRTLFTDDFRFAFAVGDTHGIPPIDWRREDEFVYAQHLFVGGHPTEEPASSIHVRFVDPLLALPDPRPGRDPSVHAEVRADVVLTVRRPSGDIVASGGSVFHVTRGDSALVPAGLPADASHWYIDHWEDQAVPSAVVARSGAPVSRAMPSSGTSWGRLKLTYR